MEKQMTQWLETLLCPALSVSNGKNVMCRNRLARRLLPPAARLRGQLFDFRDDFMKELLLDGVSYLVISLPLKESQLFCFFEHFLPLQEGLSRVIVEKMQDFFWSLLCDEENENHKNVVCLDQIAARVHSLRMYGENYLRLITRAQMIENAEAKTCSLKGFFMHLSKALNVYGVPVTFCDCRDLTVFSESAVLSFLVLNLIHFAHLFESKNPLSLEVSEEDEHVRFSMKISDRGAVKSSLESLILQGKGSEELLRVLPLLCILRVCMEKGIPWNVSVLKGETCFSFSLAKGSEDAVLFLTDSVAEEVSELLQMIKGIFF